MYRSFFYLKKLSTKKKKKKNRKKNPVTQFLVTPLRRYAVTRFTNNRFTQQVYQWKFIVCELCELCEMKKLYFVKWKSVLYEMEICTLQWVSKTQNWEWKTQTSKLEFLIRCLIFLQLDAGYAKQGKKCIRIINTFFHCTLRHAIFTQQKDRGHPSELFESCWWRGVIKFM